MMPIAKELISTVVKSKTQRVIWLCTALLYGLFLFLFRIIGQNPPKEFLCSIQTVQVVLVILTVLMGSVASLIFLLKEKLPKLNMDEFTLHRDGYYVHPEHANPICPECLHADPLKAVPMSDSSGTWVCVGKGHTLPVAAAACASVDPPARERLILK